MIRSEGEFRQEVTKQAKLMGFHASNIESHLTSAGIPDTNLAIGHVDIWLELKVFGAKHPMKIRPTQRKWHKDRAEVKGLSWFAILDIDHQIVFLVPGASIHYVGTGLTRQWQGSAVQFSTEQIDLMIAYMYHEAVKRRAEYVRSNNQRVCGGNAGQEQQPDSERTANHSGIPGDSLPEGGQSVGEHHWLLNKP